MPKANSNSEPADVPAPSQKDCPVQVQSAGWTPPTSKSVSFNEGPTDEEKTDLWEAIRILRDLVSITRAQSDQRALFQIELAREAAKEMTKNLPAFASTSDPEIRTVHLQKQRLDRDLDSVAQS